MRRIGMRGDEGKDFDRGVVAAEALAEDCARAAVVVSTAQAQGCKGPAVVIDQKTAGEGWRTLSPVPAAVSVRSYRGERPWVTKDPPSP